MKDQEVKLSIQSALKSFTSGTVTDHSISLFKILGYNTERQNPFTQKTFTFFKESFLDGRFHFNEEKALVKEWKSVDLLFQLTKDEVSDQKSLFSVKKIDNAIIETYLFFALELTKTEYSRTALAQITREINKVFPMPAMLLFIYGNHLTLSVINRRLNKKNEQKDVLEKVTLIKDISIVNPHRAHIEILFDLSFTELKRVYKITNFIELHNAWQKTLDSKELNNRFYRELSNWYFWALKNVSFPNDINNDKDDIAFNSESIIRLLTRIIFIWFIKEKKLIPDKIFNESEVSKLIKGFKKEGSTVYYRAILQNLFFATLNQKIEDRAFATDGTFEQNKKNYGIKNLYRYSSDFFISNAEVIKLFAGVPFLNGGLFDCLDSEDKSGKVIYLDGFSRNIKKQAQVPDELFFSQEKKIDLSGVYDDNKKRNETVKGLFEIFSKYKFTITENTPIEEEVALDPELLGRVFENLLASYNPETKTTARKKTGSFYTPREIVNYMVDESLKVYLKQKLETKTVIKAADAEKGLEFLFGYNEKENTFNKEQTMVLINAIDTCKILDPSCGSGAFPMGILHKLVYILHKLDPKNKLWEERQIEKANAIDDPEIRDGLIADIETAFSNNELDYGRKLYLIENCIYGVDIQPIATQISKLRFFISLIVDQKANEKEDNFGIRPLPNLETKFVAANMLFGIIKPSGVLRNINLDKLEKNLKDIRHRLFSAKTPIIKRKLREEDHRLRKEMEKVLEDSGWSNESAHQLAAWDPYNQNVSSSFFESEWMFGIANGFDVVIGNPPYVEAKKLKDISQTLRKFHSTYSGTADLYVYFYESGIKNLTDSGTLVFITSNKFIKTRYGENLRKYFLNFKINEIIDFTDVHVFDALVASCIFSISKRNGLNNKIKIAFVNDSLIDFDDISLFVKENKFNLLQNELSEKIWQLEKENRISLKEKIEKGSLTLNQTQTINIYRGVTTGFNPAFIVTEEKRNELIKADKSNDLIIKPILQGRNIRKWVYNSSNSFMLQTGYNINIPKDYPTLFAHLSIFKTELEIRADQGVSWWNLRACKYYSEFEKEKIVWGLTSDKWTFAYDNQGNYLPSNGYILTSTELPIKYLLGLLNSKLMEFYFGFIGIMTAGGAYTLKYETVNAFPIKIVNDKYQKQFVHLIEFILYLKKGNKDSSFFERLNDAMVYELYFPDEIKSAGAEVLKYLISSSLTGFDVLPKLKNEWSNVKKLETIEKVYDEISDPKHPVSIALFKLDTVNEVRIIEGKQ